MKHETRTMLAAATCALLLASCSSTTRPDARAGESSPTPSLSYMGQIPPGTEALAFAPGVVNTAAIELNGVFTPDGREFFFTRHLDGIGTIHHSVLGPDGWSAPVPLDVYGGSARSLAVDMAVSPDGDSLYFLGQHPHPGAPVDPTTDIWVSRRVDGKWSTAEVVPAPVSTAAEELYPVVVADGSLYFSSDRDNDAGRLALWRAQRLPDGRFAEPVKLPPPINHEAGIGDTYVTPDERTIVFSSRRLPSAGNGDLYVAFRLADGSWSQPASLGPGINTAEHEFCPMATPDGRYLFYSRRFGATWETTTEGEVYWVDMRILDPFRPGNG